MTKKVEGFTSQEEEMSTTKEESDICTNIHWEEGKEKLNEYSDFEEMDDWDNWVELALEMYRYDPERFERDIQITDSMWQGFFTESKNRITDRKSRGFQTRGQHLYDILNLPASTKELADLLQELEPEKFIQNLEMTEKDWRYGVIEPIAIERQANLLLFILFYDMAHTIYPQKITKELPISEDDWEEIREEIQKLGNIILATKAQNIKPEGFPDITFSQTQWEEEKSKMVNVISSGNYKKIATVFKCANTLKNKEIKIED